MALARRLVLSCLSASAAKCEEKEGFDGKEGISSGEEPCVPEDGDAGLSGSI